MAPTEKHLRAENQEKRQSARLDEYRPISVKDQKTGLFHKSTMLNYSRNGMYFETDSLLQPGTEVYIGIESSPQVEFTDGFECKLAKITWRKKLKKSFYKYGYGVKFITTDNKMEPKCANQKQKVDLRRHPRKPYSNSVLYAADSQILEGISLNVSSSGIFIETNNRLRVGQTIILSLPSKTEKRVNMRCEVVWSNHEGFGVKFLKKL